MIYIYSDACIDVLNSCMALLRHCRLNAALTIQLFSQLFHFINMYLFNWLVSIEGASYCSRSWGYRLGTRLQCIQQWAEKQGLELAAECHLDRIAQVCIGIVVVLIISGLGGETASHSEDIRSVGGVGQYVL